MAVDVTGQREEDLGSAADSQGKKSFSSEYLLPEGPRPYLLKQSERVLRRSVVLSGVEWDCGWRQQEVMSRSRMASKVKAIQSTVMLCPRRSHKKWAQANKATEGEW